MSLYREILNTNVDKAVKGFSFQALKNNKATKRPISDHKFVDKQLINDGINVDKQINCYLYCRFMCLTLKG